MITLVGLVLSLFFGYLIVRLAADNRLNPLLHGLLALALGLGFIGHIGFYVHILFHQFNRWTPLGLTAAIVFIVWLLDRKRKLEKLGTDTHFFIPNLLGLVALALLAIPLMMEAAHYPLGGWDAWSCWNLKAKFIFLGREHWPDMLSPNLWRSNTHYPLLVPLINVWFWDLCGRFDQTVPMANSVIFSLLTAGILLFGLLELTNHLWGSIAVTVAVFALPFFTTLAVSQYSDIVLALFLLSAFTCLLLAQKYNAPKLKILTMLFLGLLSFTKTEGLVAAGIAGALILWQDRHNQPLLKNLIIALAVAALPTALFALGFAPKNETFINGLLTPDKPSGFARLSVIALYPWFELLSAKWNGLWLLMLAGMVLAGKKLWRGTLGTIGLCLIGTLAAALAYYHINTFFEIRWWLSTTFARILCALIPTACLWVAMALF